LDVSIVHQPAQICICMLEVIKDWSWKCPGMRLRIQYLASLVHVEFAFNNIICIYNLSYKYMYGLQ